MGRSNPFAAAVAHLEQDGMSRFSSVTQREDAIKGMAFAEMSQVLGTFRRNLVGEVRQKAQLKNMTREIFGESTGDASAKEMAAAWTKTAETLRKKFNRAGGSIPKNEKWFLPQNHQSLKISKAGYEAWRSNILPKLSPNDMIDQVTGLAFTPQRLELALKDVYETITTEGANKMTPGSGGRGKSLANQRQDHRFLVFKDADSWLEYQKEFGDDNVFDVMVSHISNMSRDISMMEVLGPNPTSTITFMKDTLTKQAKMAKDEALKDKARSTGKRLDDMYMAVSGRKQLSYQQQVCIDNGRNAPDLAVCATWCGCDLSGNRCQLPASCPSILWIASNRHTRRLLKVYEPLSGPKKKVSLLLAQA